LHARAYGSTELLRDAAPRLAERLRVLFEAAFRSGSARQQCVERRAVGGKPGKLRAQGFGMGMKCGRGHSMFAREVHDRFESRLYALQRSGVCVQAVVPCAQVADGIVDELARRAQRFARAFEARVRVVHVLEQTLCAPDGAIFGQQMQRVGRSVAQRVGLGQSAMKGVDLLEFACRQAEAIELFQLVGEQCCPVFPCRSGGAEFLGRAGRRTPFAKGFATGLPQTGVDAMVVQQRELDIAPQEARVFVLTVDIDQTLAQGFERLQRGRRSVHKRSGTSVGADHAPHQAAPRLVRVIEREFAEQRERSGIGAEIEFSRNISTGGAGPHDVRRAALP
jgi:hypothetical protein